MSVLARYWSFPHMDGMCPRLPPSTANPVFSRGWGVRDERDKAGGDHLRKCFQMLIFSTSLKNADDLVQKFALMVQKEPCLQR